MTASALKTRPGLYGFSGRVELLARIARQQRRIAELEEMLRSKGREDIQRCLRARTERLELCQRPPKRKSDFV